MTKVGSTGLFITRRQPAGLPGLRARRVRLGGCGRTRPGQAPPPCWSSVALIKVGVGTPTNAYQQMLGHSAKTALEHYVIVNDEDLKAAFHRVQKKLASDDDDG